MIIKDVFYGLVMFGFVGICFLVAVWSDMYEEKVTNGITILKQIPSKFSMLRKMVKTVNPNLTELIDEEDFPAISPSMCKLLKISDVWRIVSFTMCVKPREVDVHISGTILNGGMWERGMVEMVLGWMRLYPNATFLDVGSNIGMYSVAVASFGYKVVAVDAIDTNIAYVHKSASFQEDPKIRYIHNSISNESMVLYPWNADPTNEGGMVLITADQIQDKQKELIGGPIQSVTFEDVLEIIDAETIILKIDIEGGECKALMNYLASEVKIRYIPYISIEWFQIEDNARGCCPEKQEILKKFTESGYSPHSPGATLVPLNVKKRLTYDVVWVHKDALVN